MMVSPGYEPLQTGAGIVAYSAACLHSLGMYDSPVGC